MIHVGFPAAEFLAQQPQKGGPLSRRLTCCPSSRALREAQARVEVDGPVSWSVPVDWSAARTPQGTSTGGVGSTDPS